MPKLSKMNGGFRCVGAGARASTVAALLAAFIINYVVAVLTPAGQRLDLWIAGRVTISPELSRATGLTSPAKASCSTSR